MNASSTRNIVIIGVLGIILIAAAYFLLDKKNNPTAIEEPSQGMTFQAWYVKTNELIKENKAASALSDIESKLGQFADRDPGMKHALYELRGDAMMQLDRCAEAVESYDLARGNLSSTQFLFTRGDNEDPREKMITEQERAKFMAQLEKKLSKAQQCAR